jgi:hypothetical protein
MAKGQYERAEVRADKPQMCTAGFAKKAVTQVLFHRCVRLEHNDLVPHRCFCGEVWFDGEEGKGQ